MVIAQVYTPASTDIVHSTDADLVSRQSISEPIHLVQYDENLPIVEVRLWKENEKYAVPSNCEVNVRLEKPNGKYVYNHALGLRSDRMAVYVQVTEIMSDAFGDAIAIIEIKSAEDKVVGTATFQVIFDYNPVQRDGIKASSEFKALIHYVEDAEAAADESEEWAGKSAASAAAAKVSETNAANSATASANSAAASKDSQDAAKVSETNTANSATASANSAAASKDSQDAAKVSETNAANSATASANSAAASKASQDAAKVSETNAANSATASANSAAASKASQDAAKVSETNAANSATASANSATDSSNSANESEEWAGKSAASAATAESHKNAAATSETEAKTAESNAKTSENAAKDWSERSKSYAVGTDDEYRAGDSVDNSKYYYEQSKRLVQGYEGIMPMGTITFADLDNPDNQVPKYMFNISDSFTSDSRFKDGGGKEYPAGMNVFYTMDEMWDVMSGASVIGIKGKKEEVYRQGNVTLAPEEIGAIPETVDIPTYESDLNNYTTPGFYSKVYTPGVANCPIDSSASLIVTKAGANIRQLLFAANALENGIYERYKDANNGWSAWNRLIQGVKGNAETEYRGGLVNLTPENIGAFQGSTRLTNEDLNNVKDPGVYYTTGGHSVTNTPNNEKLAFSLVVLKNASSYYIQRLTYVSENSPSRLYERIFNGSNWASWYLRPLGIKGEAETEYRGGYVNLTKENLGIGIADTTNPGILKVDGDTAEVASDGTLQINFPEGVKLGDVALTGAVTGSGTFDENGNVDILTSRKGCIAHAGNTNGGWYNVAYAAVPKAYQDYSASFLVQCTYANDKSFGILRVMSRILPTGLSSASITLECTNMTDPTGFVLTYNDNDSGRIELRIWVRNQTQWQGVTFTVLSESLGERIDGVFTLYNPTGSDALSEIPAEYTQVPCALATIQNPVAGAATAPITVPANADMNNYTTPGFYSLPWESTQNAINLPSRYTNTTYNMTLIVLKAATLLTQLIYPVDSARPLTIFIRHFTGNAWASWYEYATRVKGNAETAYRGGDVNLTPENIGALSLAGGELAGPLGLKKGQYVSYSGGISGTGGYVVFARLVVKSTYVNHPITMIVGSRGLPIVTMISILFGSTSSLDPPMDYFLKYGGDKRIFIKKTGTSTWDLCMQKNENYGDAEVAFVSGHSIAEGAVQITYPNTQINTADFVASEWTEAQLGGRILEAATADVADRLNTFVSTTNSKLNTALNAIGYTVNEAQLRPIYGQTDGAIYQQAYSDKWIHQIYGDYRTGAIALRSESNGTWQSWRKVVDHLNYDNLIPAATTSKAGLMSAAQVTALNNKAPASKSSNYVRTHNVYDESVNDLAKDYYAMGMVSNVTDNPTGANNWIHVISMAWEDGVNTSWISQLAFGTQVGNGLWYRTASDTIVGKPWKRVLDSSNYKNYVPTPGNGTITITQNGVNKGSFTMNQSGNATIALTDTDTNTTYGVATASSNGLMSADDKVKLNKLSGLEVRTEYTSFGVIMYVENSTGATSSNHQLSDAVTILRCPGTGTNAPTYFFYGSFKLFNFSMPAKYGTIGFSSVFNNSVVNLVSAFLNGSPLKFTNNGRNIGKAALDFNNLSISSSSELSVVGFIIG